MCVIRGGGYCVVNEYCFTLLSACSNPYAHACVSYEEEDTCVMNELQSLRTCMNPAPILTHMHASIRTQYELVYIHASCTCAHTCITYTRTHMHACIHVNTTCIHAYTNTNLCYCIHVSALYMHACVHARIHTCTQRLLSHKHTYNTYLYMHTYNHI
jgi:hypothetical protein